MDEYTLLHGDCLAEMAAMDADSVDAVCCDPPYGLEFMGKEWDRLGATAASFDESLTEEGRVDYHGKGNAPFGGGGKRIRYGSSAATIQAWHQQWASEALRVLKPSHYLLAFGGTRTWHRLACAIEDAGFEVRDTLMWLYGSGFPKGKSCLKPAWEPIILARKPGPMRELGIEECRIDAEPRTIPIGPRINGNTVYGDGLKGDHHGRVATTSGRWPANLILECTCDETREGTAKTNTPGKRPSIASPGYGGGFGPTTPFDYNGPDGKEPVRIHTDPNCPCAMLDGQTGTLTSNPGKLVRNPDKTRNAYGAFAGNREEPTVLIGDSGGASRFFYAPKASRAERGEGNTHPTVKSLALMRWLVRLVARPGDVVLDPFMGSGTTGVACAEEGREFIGIERELDYVEIARRRIGAASSQTRLPVE